MHNAVDSLFFLEGVGPPVYMFEGMGAAVEVFSNHFLVGII